MKLPSPEVISDEGIEAIELEVNTKSSGCGGCPVDLRTDQFRALFYALKLARHYLKEIKKGSGPFSRDPLTHAGNTIEAMKADAERGLGERDRE